MKLFFVPRLSICRSSTVAVVRYANVATFRKSLWQTRQRQRFKCLRFCYTMPSMAQPNTVERAHLVTSRLDDTAGASAR